MIRAIFIALAFACASAAGAATSTCPINFYQGVAPDIVNPKLAVQARPLCFTAFAVMHSGVARTPLWSAEYLTATRISDSRQMNRQNTFHAEESLPPGERAELSDYARSGYDRGHMSPSGDMPDLRSQYDSFSLANMVPQDRKNNQQLWASLEDTVRKLVQKRGALYVVTGPLFEGNSLSRLKGRVLVPSGLYKAVLDPATGAAGAYIADNTADATLSVISLAELERRSGLRLFPQLSEAGRENPAALPLPKPRKKRAP